MHACWVTVLPAVAGTWMPGKPGKSCKPGAPENNSQSECVVPVKRLCSLSSNQLPCAMLLALDPSSAALWCPDSLAPVSQPNFSVRNCCLCASILTSAHGGPESAMPVQRFCAPPLGSICVECLRSRPHFWATLLHRLRSDHNILNPDTALAPTQHHFVIDAPCATNLVRLVWFIHLVKWKCSASKLTDV